MSSASPSLPQLRAFAAAARYGSFSAAAKALGVSQSALSHAIGQLEKLLAAKLFLRTSRSCKLTPTGEALLPRVQSALADVDGLAALARRSASEAELKLLVIPSFASYFLIDRLPAWQTRHGGIAFTFERHFLEYEGIFTEADAAILWGDGSWPNAESVLLGGNELVVVAAPRHPAIKAFARGKVDRSQLLNHVEVSQAWQQVASEAQIVFSGSEHALSFNLYSQVLDAAERGLGVAALPRFVAARALERGTLVTVIERRVRLPGGYYLVHKPEVRYSAALRSFREWLLGQVRAGL